MILCISDSGSPERETEFPRESQNYRTLTHLNNGLNLRRDLERVGTQLSVESVDKESNSDGIGYGPEPRSGFEWLVPRWSVLGKGWGEPGLDFVRDHFLINFRQLMVRLLSSNIRMYHQPLKSHTCSLLIGPKKRTPYFISSSLRCLNIGSITETLTRNFSLRPEFILRAKPRESICYFRLF
jgi:hypothetical protein